jgi:hypothetical protein
MRQEEKALKSKGSWAIGASIEGQAKETELYTQVQAILGLATRYKQVSSGSPSYQSIVVLGVYTAKEYDNTPQESRQQWTIQDVREGKK